MATLVEDLAMPYDATRLQVLSIWIREICQFCRLRSLGCYCMSRTGSRFQPALFRLVFALITRRALYQAAEKRRLDLKCCPDFAIFVTKEESFGCSPCGL